MEEEEDGEVCSPEDPFSVVVIKIDFKKVFFAVEQLSAVNILFPTITSRGSIEGDRDDDDNDNGEKK